MVVGGWAMNSYGRGRATFDLDLAVPRSVQDDLVGFLESAGYETLHRSSGYSNHLHPSPDWGRVDVIYVRDETEARLFRDAVLRPVLPDRSALVPKPTHLVAMKVTAMKHDPSRRLDELADIRALLRLSGTDPKEVREYFVRDGLLDDYEQITKTS